MEVEKISKELNIHYEKIQVNKDQLNGALDEWSTILKSYLADFDVKQIQLIYNNFNNILDILSTSANCLCHGDFHAENMMFDNNRLILADWQNISIGNGATDISFFISRGKASGMIINEDEIINYYCKRIYYYSGIPTEKNKIYKVINASNVFISYMYWAFYLRDSNLDRVRGIYGKMISSFKSLEL